MKGIIFLALLFYTLIIVIIAAALIGLSLDILTFDKIIYYYQLHDLKLTAGVVGAAVIVLNLIVLRIMFAGAAGQKTVKFKTGQGPVTVSISAIKSLTENLLRQFPEIKSMRPRIFAGRRGITVLIRTALYAGASVPEVTEKVQQHIKTRLQETLGAEKNIFVKIQVDKIEQPQA